MFLRLLRQWCRQPNRPPSLCRRCCSDRERARGDREVWECHGNAVGILEDVGMTVKFIYDHVFDPLADNRLVYKTVASPIVQSALDGINGTVFACGCF